MCLCVPQASSSSDSVEGPCVNCAAKSYDAVVFDVLKVTPEEFAVSDARFLQRFRKDQNPRNFLLALC